MCGLRHLMLLHCVAHRLNNILKMAFYQQTGCRRENVTSNKSMSTGSVESESKQSKAMNKATTMESLPSSAKQVLHTIKDCTSLVGYVKEVIN
jgi:hypothetical protein